MYDATFKWWDWAVDSVFAALAQKFNITQEETVKLATTKLASSICDTAQRFCNGTNLQYEGQEQCQEYLTKEVRFGKPYELGT